MSNSDQSKEDRWALITKLLTARNGQARFGDLKEALGISSATLTRDLTEMADLRLITRPHGWVKLVVPGARDDAANEIDAIAIAHDIGKTAAALVIPGNTILLEGGPYTRELARCLGHRRNVTVITNDVQIAQELLHNAYVTTILLGGEVDPVTGSTSPCDAWEAQLAPYPKANKAFLNDASLSQTQGMCVPRAARVDVCRTMMAYADSSIILAERHTLLNDFRYKVAQVNEIGGCVTDAGVTVETVKDFKEMGVTLTIAGTENVDAREAFGVR